MENLLTITEESIKSKIYTIRSLQVMLDSDLAELYGVSTKVLNQAVKRNIERFPLKFMFQLTEKEYENLRSQFVTSSLGYDSSNSQYNLSGNVNILISQNVISSSNWGGRRKLPYVFTEQGVAMLSGVLRTETAINVSIQIIEAFVSMRKFIQSNSQVFQRLDRVELKQIEHDNKFDIVFDAIQSKQITPNKGIFFDGQVFDAYKFISDIIKSAKNSIILIDNYVDDSVLTLFSERDKDMNVVIYTSNFTKKLKLDLEKYNSQYPKITIKEFKHSHDRFMIVDDSIVYHIGASLKDLGKKWFGFSKFDKEAFGIMERLEQKEFRS